MSQIIAIFKKVLIIFPLFVVIPVIIILSVLNKPLFVFPHNEYQDRISAYSDDELKGESKIIDFDILDNKIIFTYMLKESSMTSFAGIGFDVSLLDISDYDIMELHIIATSPARYLINLMSFIEGQSRVSELDTFAHFNKLVELKEANEVYRIDINNLVKTEYEKVAQSKKKSWMQNRPTKLLFIHLKEMVNVDNIKENSWSFDKVKTIIIEEISFHRSYFLYYILIVSALVVYYGFYLFFILWKRKLKNDYSLQKTKTLPLIQLEVETYEEEDLKKIMPALQQNIFDPEFSIHTVYNITGQSTKRIAMIIKDKYNLSFKQLINSIRLNEAKRLLLKSDLKIYDIAYKIGYNNNTYFCKLFKKQFGLTPKDYRHFHME